MVVIKSRKSEIYKSILQFEKDLCITVLCVHKLENCSKCKNEKNKYKYEKK